MLYITVSKLKFLKKHFFYFFIFAHFHVYIFTSVYEYCTLVFSQTVTYVIILAI